MYSSAFRRLGGVTQVAAANERIVFRNRLTHTLEVAQIARRLAEYTAADQPDAAEALGGVGQSHLIDFGISDAVKYH